MPSALTHPAIPLALAAALGRGVVSRRLLLAGVACSVLPDADVLGWQLGIPYGSLFGHRGFSHSLAFALLLGLGAAAAARRLAAGRLASLAFVLVSTASHGVLDAMTNGGKGIAFASPFSNERWFLPWRPIAVAPLNADDFFGEWGLRVLASEACWVWLPCLALAALAKWGRAKWGRGSMSAPRRTGRA